MFRPSKETVGAQTSGKVGPAAYVSLFLLIVFFTGLAKYGPEVFRWFDYSVILGRFGFVEEGKMFLGVGGEGVRYATVYGVGLIPGIMLALGAAEVATRFGALDAAHVLLNRLFRPLLGIPGVSGVAVITSLQSSDAGAAMTRDLFDRGVITARERTILAMFQYSSGASVIIYLTVACVLFPFIEIHYLAPLGVVLVCKVLGANLMRFYLRREKP